jgi:cell division protein FtsQ
MSRRPPSFTPTGNPARGTVEVVERDSVVTGLSDRLAERQRARRRLRIRTIGAVAAVVLVLAAAGYVLLASPWLALRADAVEVSGTDEIATSAEVLAVVTPWEGQPLLRLDTAGLREQLLEITGVRDATVQRSFPHGLVITVEPRVPVATVAQDGGFVLLDSDGVALATSDAPAEGVPVVEVPIGTEDTAAALDAVLTVMAALPASILEQVATASATTAHEVEFVLASGARVVWGSAAENDLKSAVLERLLTVAAEVYDVSAPLSPITR